MEDFQQTTTALVPLKKEEPMTSRPASSFMARLLSKPLYLPGATQVEIGQPWTTDFREMVHLLKRQGVANGHLKAALAILIGLNSANLENPMALEIIDNEERNAGKILNGCLTLVPGDFRVEFDTIPKDFFLLQRDRLKGRVIIDRDSSSYEKVAVDLNTLLAQQKLESTQTIIGKYGSAPHDVSVRGPVGFISIARDEERAVLNHPSFLKIRLISGEPPQDPSLVFDPKGVPEMQRMQFILGLQRIIASFKRLCPRPVVIPFREAILSHLSKTRNGPKGETFLNALRVITLINRPPGPSTEEQVAKAWGCDFKMIEAAAGTQVFPNETLVANKVDYYTFWAIMSDLVRNDAVSLTPVQKRVRQVITNWNLEGLKIIWGTGTTDAEKLIDISHADIYWADIDDIFKELNKDGEEPVGSTGTVRNRVKELLDLGEIQEGQYPGSKNRNGYFVTSFDTQDTVTLPHPSEIEGPGLGKEKIKVQNPITGEIIEV